ncbi:MAG: cysteine desulfurase family protein [Candidatus Nealsonbacteria bacterium]|nr:cysteine desulfurase family protein [Candidatus Nealsonbacteria bacterium]
MSKQSIYLDYAATTPIDPKVLKEMMPYLKKDFGNPSSIHSFGLKGQEAIDNARAEVAKFLNCLESEIIFTGSATEANNLAIFGTVKALKSKVETPHIITTKIEHPAVLEPFRFLEKRGVEVTYLPVSKEGIVNFFEIEKSIKKNTILVSIIYANNEIGTIQPIKEISKIISNYRVQNDASKIVFHTDAVQAINYLNCDVKELGVDLLTLSAHKIYGPKGVGCLYVKEGTALAPLVFGGGQENGKRSGTENVAGIVGLGAAVKLVKKEKPKNKKIIKLRDKIIKEVLKTISGSKINGSLEKRLCNNINFTLPGAEGESIVMALDREGIAVSTGSACSSKSLEPSFVLMALGLSEKDAHCSLRVSLGRYTSPKEIDQFLKILPKTIKKLRIISGY